MLQIHHFPDGGFVIHKAIDGKTSGWFDASGKLVDASYTDRLGRIRPEIGAVRREQLESLGRVYRP